MSKRIYILLCSTAMMLGSCTLHDSDNGDLDNLWYLRQIDTIATNGTTDYTAQRIFWSFQASMMHSEKMGTSRMQYYLCKFSKTDKDIRIHSPYFDSRPLGDTLMWEKDTTLLSTHGMYFRNVNGTLEATYAIDELNGKTMTLSNGTYRLHFERY